MTPKEEADALQRDAEAVMDRVRTLDNEIISHPGEVFFQRWRALGVVHSLMVLNERDLLRLLDEPNEDRDLIIELFQNVREPTVADRYSLEFYRRLHNYTAAVKTLVDHSRVLVKKESDTGFLSRYETRKDRLIAQPVVMFVQGLRNHVLHNRFPDVTHRINYSGETQELSYRLLVQKTELATFDWPLGAKKYLDEQADEFPLRQPIEAYRLLVEDLYSWLFQQFDAIHGAEVAERDALVKTRNALLSGEAPP